MLKALVYIGGNADVFPFGSMHEFKSSIVLWASSQKYNIKNFMIKPIIWLSTIFIDVDTARDLTVSMELSVQD